MGTPELAQLVRTIRPQRGMSLDDLARAANVPFAELEAFESRGQPLSTSQLRRVAAAFEVEFAAFMRGELVEEPQPSLFFRHLGSPDLHEDDREDLAAVLCEAEALAAVVAILEPKKRLLVGKLRRVCEAHRISANRARELLGLSLWDPLPWESQQ